MRWCMQTSFSISIQCCQTCFSTSGKTSITFNEFKLVLSACLCSWQWFSFKPCSKYVGADTKWCNVCLEKRCKHPGCNDQSPTHGPSLCTQFHMNDTMADATLLLLCGLEPLIQSPWHFYFIDSCMCSLLHVYWRETDCTPRLQIIIVDANCWSEFLLNDYCIAMAFLHPSEVDSKSKSKQMD